MPNTKKKDKTKTDEFSTKTINHDDYYGKIMNVGISWFNPNESHIDDLCGWSLDFQTYYIILRLLERTQPKNILELGFGFSSLPINQYARSFGARHDVCEGNQKWIDHFREKYCKDGKWNFNLIVKKEIVETIDGHENCRIYEDFKSNLNPPYDFVLIDGPHGSKDTISRANILNDIDVLAGFSTIVFHDTERDGEKLTVGKMMEKMNGYKRHDFSMCSVITNLDVSESEMTGDSEG